MQNVPEAADSNAIEFDLNRRLPVDVLARQFAASGRLVVEDFLAPDSAAALRSHLEQSEAWRHLFNAKERFYEMSSAEWDSLSNDKREILLSEIDEAAAFDFQYQYDTIRVPDLPSERSRANGLLDRFAEFLSSETVLEVMMRITNSRDLKFADCQATRYRPGDFLTPHNDELEGMQRSFAYVLSLTENWLPRWGGLLHFVDGRGGVDETITPRFNALSLFAVGQSHYVSQVATYAPIPRISVTGWLRRKVPG